MLVDSRCPACEYMNELDLCVDVGIDDSYEEDAIVECFDCKSKYIDHLNIRIDIDINSDTQLLVKGPSLIKASEISNLKLNAMEEVENPENIEVYFDNHTKNLFEEQGYELPYPPPKIRVIY